MMKFGLIGVGLSMVLALPVLAAECHVPGGWQQVAVNDPGVVAAADFAIQRQQKLLNDGGQHVTLSLDRILSAEQQVVQGMNYRLTLQLKVDKLVKKAEAQVWARVWLEPEERYKLTTWKFLDEEPRQMTTGKPRR